MSGFYRQAPEGTPGADWAEGAGWIIYDEQARIEGQAAAKEIAKSQFTWARDCALSEAAKWQRKLDQLDEV